MAFAGFSGLTGQPYDEIRVAIKQRWSPSFKQGEKLGDTINRFASEISKIVPSALDSRAKFVKEVALDEAVRMTLKNYRPQNWTDANAGNQEKSRAWLWSLATKELTEPTIKNYVLQFAKETDKRKAAYLKTKGGSKAIAPGSTLMQMSSKPASLSPTETEALKISNQLKDLGDIQELLIKVAQRFRNKDAKALTINLKDVAKQLSDKVSTVGLG